MACESFPRLNSEIQALGSDDAATARMLLSPMAVFGFAAVNESNRKVAEMKADRNIGLRWCRTKRFIKVPRELWGFRCHKVAMDGCFVEAVNKCDMSKGERSNRRS